MRIERGLGFDDLVGGTAEASNCTLMIPVTWGSSLCHSLKMLAPYPAMSIRLMGTAPPLPPNVLWNIVPTSLLSTLKP